jgi:hypothetical protein
MGMWLDQIRDILLPGLRSLAPNSHLLSDHVEERLVLDGKTLFTRAELEGGIFKLASSFKSRVLAITEAEAKEENDG